MGRPRMAPGHPQPNPRDPKMGPSGPKMAPKKLKMALGRPRELPDGSWGRPRSCLWPPDRPGPKTSKIET